MGVLNDSTSVGARSSLLHLLNCWLLYLLGFWKLLVSKHSHFGWCVSTNLFVDLVVLGMLSLLKEFPFAFLAKLLHIWTIPVFVKILNPGGEDANSIVFEGQEHFFEDWALEMIIGQDS